MGLKTAVKIMAAARYGRGYNVPADVANALGDARDDAKLAVQASASADASVRPGGQPGETPRPMPPLLFVDGNYLLKYSQPEFASGVQLANEQVLAPFTSFFQSPHGHSAWLALDQGSPPNKGATHQHRYANVTPMETPPPDVAASLITDEHIVDADLWRPFTSNRYLAALLVHYLTKYVLGDHLPEDVRYTPPLNKRLFIHGGRRMPPPHPSSGRSAAGSPDHGGHRQDGRMRAERVPPPPPELLYVHHCIVKQELTHDQNEGLPSRYKQYMLERPRIERRSGADPAVDTEAIRNLQEGELAVMYYAVQQYQQNPTLDAAFLSVDGDLVIILLLMARDRIDPDTGFFRNRHVLWLKVPGRGMDTFDINTLYEDISEDPALSAVHDPVLSWCALSCLCFNDFMLSPLTGIGIWKGGAKQVQDSSADMPYLYRAFLDAPEVWSTMFRIITAARGNPNAPLEPAIDEPRFLAFLKYVYVCKWWDLMVALADRIVGMSTRKRRPLTGAQIAKKLAWDQVAHDNAHERAADWDPLAWAEALQALVASTPAAPAAQAARPNAPPSPATAAARRELARLVRIYLRHQRRKNPEYHLPSDDRLRVIMRQLLWLLEYWINGYRGTCLVESPLATYQGLAYYGWERDHRGWVVPAPRVSPARRTAGGHVLDTVLRPTSTTPPPTAAVRAREDAEEDDTQERPPKRRRMGRSMDDLQPDTSLVAAATTEINTV